MLIQLLFQTIERNVVGPTLITITKANRKRSSLVNQLI